jgi:hypothetical protein
MGNLPECRACGKVWCREVQGGIWQGFKIVRKVSVDGYVVTYPNLIKDCEVVQERMGPGEMERKLLKMYKGWKDDPHIAEDGWTGAPDT